MGLHTFGARYIPVTVNEQTALRREPSQLACSFPSLLEPRDFLVASGRFDAESLVAKSPHAHITDRQKGAGRARLPCCWLSVHADAA